MAVSDHYPRMLELPGERIAPADGGRKLILDSMSGALRLGRNAVMRDPLVGKGLMPDDEAEKLEEEDSTRRKQNLN